ncbi:MAG: monothiol glutaredoxin, Grx4 family [Alphaproteobacteria bacterium]|nr:monothiol glutaredoxin, Grx4 family [Alphaproteobacteria bacterium]
MTDISNDPVLSRIDAEVKGNDIVLFMKGSKKLPQCGFSGVVAAVMERLGITEYRDINVLADQDIREGVKLYSQWPTIPQLYIKGEFIGGCDIVKEMYQSGELQSMLKEKGIPFSENNAA